MSIPGNQPLGDVHHIRTQASAIATVFYLPVLKTGRVKKFVITVDAAVTTADETFTLSYQAPGTSGFVAVTSGVVVQPTASSAAGATIEAAVGPSTTAYVRSGGTFKITPSGGGGGGVPLTAAVTVGN